MALFNPSGELLFSNPAMQPTLPGDAIGRALQGAAARRATRIARSSRRRWRRAGRRSRVAAVAPSGAGGRLKRPTRLLMTHAIAGTNGELVGVLLVSRNLAHLSRMQSTLAYSRKLVALGRLTAGIAHEVKNPLNAMMIHLELLRTKIRATRSRAAGAGRRPAACSGWPERGAASASTVQGALSTSRHRERNPAARRSGAGVSEVHAARGPAAAAGAASTRCSTRSCR